MLWLRSGQLGLRYWIIFAPVFSFRNIESLYSGQRTQTNLFRQLVSFNHGANFCSFNYSRSGFKFLSVYTDHLVALLPQTRVQFYILFCLIVVMISPKVLVLDQGIFAYKLIVFRVNRTYFLADYPYKFFLLFLKSFFQRVIN